MDREQQLIEAAMRYQALLDRGQIVNVRAFVAAEAPELQAELTDYLELLLVMDTPQEPIVLTNAEQTLAERITERARTHWRAQISATAPSLTALRKTARLSLGQLARQIDLPVDLLQRIERGGVVAATIPSKLVARLAQVFQVTEAAIQHGIQGARLVTADLRLSAEDATDVQHEQAVDFAAALAQSSATDVQKTEWA